MATNRPAGSQTGRVLRGFDRMFRLIGAPLLALYLFVGALAGLQQQSLDLSPDDVDCEYRAQLIEHRIVALQTYRQQPHSIFSTSDSLTPLIEQSLAACARAHSPTTPRLQHLHDALQRWERARRDFTAPESADLPPTD